MIVSILRWRIKRGKRKLARIDARIAALSEKGDSKTAWQRLSYCNLICKQVMVREKIKDLQCELDWERGRYSVGIVDNWKPRHDRCRR